jgi:hypothetical protein
LIGCFPDRISQTVCLGWPRTTILLISASLVARIIGVSHQYSAVPYIQDDEGTGVSLGRSVASRTFLLLWVLLRGSWD